MQKCLIRTEFYALNFLKETRLNMLFIPTLPVKVEFTEILVMLSNTKNAKQGIGEIRGTMD